MLALSRVRGRLSVYCSVFPIEVGCQRTEFVGPTGPNGQPRDPEKPEPTDPVFPGNHIKMFNNVLAEQKLKFDRDENRRTAYSLRHTYICFRLMEGADIYQIAKNCRTSVEMIEKFYAAHIKTSLDTAAINPLRERPRPAKEQRKQARRRRKRGPAEQKQPETA